MAIYETSRVYAIWDEKGSDTSFSQDGYSRDLGLGRETSLKAHKQLPRWRDVDDGGSLHKTRYTISRASAQSDSTVSTAIHTKNSANPVLPLTPPPAHPQSDGDDEIATPVTPTPLQKPPTPDYTPPRKFLNSQLSLASTRAESFRTAREEFLSDDEYDPPVFEHQQAVRRSPVTPASFKQHRRHPSPLVNGVNVHVNGLLEPAEIVLPKSRSTDRSTTSSRSEIQTSHLAGEYEHEEFGEHARIAEPETASRATAPSPRSQSSNSQAGLEPVQDSNSKRQSLNAYAPNTVPPAPSESSNQSGEHYVDSPEAHTRSDDNSDLPQRGLSLRDRVLEARQNMTRRSTEDFGNAIGWSKQVNESEGLEDAVNSWRQSAISTGPTIEAFVVVDTTPKRRQTLRHISKHGSLRAASSPIPAPSWNSAMQSDESPLRRLSLSESPSLHHKKARLNDQSRWSYGSDISRSFSMASSGVLPRTETEVIRVAVIPKRSSSLRSSANSSRRVSIMSNGARVGSGEQYPPSSYHARDNSAEVPYRRRSSSDTNGSPMARGRDQQQSPVAVGPPVIPVRASSLSAPTSRTNSRANSLSSTPDHFRHRRIAAEKDLRNTLEKMESERFIPTLRSLQDTQKEPVFHDWAEATPSKTQPKPRKLVIGTNQRTSLDRTQQRGSLDHGPGADIPITETVPAYWEGLRTPSLLDTPFSQPSVMSMSPGPVEMGEARAVNFFPHNCNSVQLIEKHPLPESRAVREVQRQMLLDEPSTPSTTTQVLDHIDSPLRNPRQPPEPPGFKVIPPTPAAENPDKQFGRRIPGVRIKGPSVNKRRYSESFVKSLTRNLSLKNARNRKVDQDLDGSLHPFWRPRGFWDGISDEVDEDWPPHGQDYAVVQNQRGVPQERAAITGPISLVRRISERRWQNTDGNAVMKKSSYGSLSKIRAGRKLHKSSGLGIPLHFIGLHTLRERMVVAKQRKENEKREKRRAVLRSSIGANVVSHGDSRFPANMDNVSQNF